MSSVILATAQDEQLSQIAVAAPLYGDVYVSTMVSSPLDHITDGTLGKLLKKRAHVPYICALVLLWMCVTSSVIISWAASRDIFVVNNGSLVAMLAELDIPRSFSTFVPVFVASVVSNGILIWRCYVLWGTRWIMAILITLLLASSAANVYFAIIPFGHFSALFSLGLALFLFAATTVCATAIISLRIILVTRKSGARYSYTRFIQIIVQSAPLESFVLTLNSTISFAVYIVGQSRSNNVALVIALTRVMAYTSDCRMIVMGIAPTLIAVRVAEETPRTEVPRAE
ncbi:hypothetical protein D9619_013709 [Psilocybe cf. subviscida]|uniref:Uncharacterized protein n=1 Tax=Psilocybe cf. subviscida TaxID=2480587 RepID=A0A8H5EV73_9AGAR|nr:hypothetical protein D9619_013709 [Psilocybe cf. subviscida]